MPLHFEAAHGCAVDRGNGLEIYRPRMEPGRSPEEVEYQYPIYQGEKTHGIGCLGLSTVIEENGHPVRLFTLDLGQGGAIDRILKLKQQLQIDGDTFEFVQRLAEGLVKVFQSRTDNTEAAHYVALIQDAALQEHQISVSDGLARLSNGQVILAEVHVQAHPVEGAVP